MKETKQTGSDNTMKSKMSVRTSKYFQSFKYAFHVISHPFDGFWELAHEGKGDLAVANTFVFFFLLTRVLKLLCTNFQFIAQPVQHINVFEEAGSLLLPFLVLCIANWSMTTLFDGKGRFKEIYIAMSYALVPYILLQLPMIVVSNCLAFDEGSFYTTILGISIIWCVFLAFVGLMEVHDYGPGKTIIFLLFTVLGACVIIFLLLVFLSLLSDAVGFFETLYNEIVFRLN